jgi:hypothetical protein
LYGISKDLIAVSVARVSGLVRGRALLPGRAFGALSRTVGRRMSGEDDLYVEAASRAGAGGKGRAVGVGDGTDNSQA